MYNIKIYESDGVTFKKYINDFDIINVSSFSSQISGGLGAITISINYSITDQSINNRDIVKIHFDSQLIYGGYIVSKTKIYTSSQEIVTLKCVGLASLFTNMVYSQSFSSIPLSDVAKTLVDTINGEYGTPIFSYDDLSIPEETSPVYYDFGDYPTYFKAINEVASDYSRVLFIDADGKVFFRQRSDFDIHNLTLGDDVDSLEIEEESKDVENMIIVKYSGNSGIYHDLESQTLYRRNETRVDKSSSFLLESEAASYAESFFEANSSEFKKIIIIVNNEYNIFDIKPGDLVNIRNSKYELVELQVAKITYGIDTASIELEKYYSIADEIINL